MIDSNRRLYQSINTLTQKRHKIFSRVRAFFGVLIILLSAVYAPVTLATQTDEDVCAMACCIKDGHCCCKPGKAAIKGQAKDGKEHFTKAEISKPCPEECASLHTSIKTFSRDLLHATNYDSSKISVIITRTDAEQIRELTALFDSHASRAPPCVPSA